MLPAGPPPCNTIGTSCGHARAGCRVRRDMSSAQWQQTLVAQADLREALPAWRRHHPATGGDCFELLQAAADPLILRCLAAMEERSGGGSEGAGATGRGGSGLALAAARAWRRLVGEGTGEMRWLPTGCLQLLDTLHQVRALCSNGRCHLRGLGCPQPRFRVCGAGAGHALEAASQHTNTHTHTHTHTAHTHPTAAAVLLLLVGSRLGPATPSSPPTSTACPRCRWLGRMRRWWRPR